MGSNSTACRVASPLSRLSAPSFRSLGNHPCQRTAVLKPSFAVNRYPFRGYPYPCCSYPYPYRGYPYPRCSYPYPYRGYLYPRCSYPYPYRGYPYPRCSYPYPYRGYPYPRCTHPNPHCDCPRGTLFLRSPVSPASRAQQRRRTPPRCNAARGCNRRRSAEGCGCQWVATPAPWAPYEQTISDKGNYG
jgi:hypothetical protein